MQDSSCQKIVACFSFHLPAAAVTAKNHKIPTSYADQNKLLPFLLLYYYPKSKGDTVLMFVRGMKLLLRFSYIFPLAPKHFPGINTIQTQHNWYSYFSSHIQNKRIKYLNIDEERSEKSVHQKEHTHKKVISNTITSKHY